MCGLEFLVLISISHPSLSQSHFVALDPEVSIQRRTQMCLGKRGEEGRKNQRLSVYRLDLSFVIFWKWWKEFAEVLMDILQVTNYCTLLKYSASSHCLGQPCDFYVPATSQLPLSCSGDSCSVSKNVLDWEEDVLKCIKKHEVCELRPVSKEYQ